MEQLTKTPPVGRKRLGKGIASSLAILLAFAGMQAGTSAAFAEDSAGLPTVAMSNGGKTEVTSYEDEIEYQAQITAPAGVTLNAGSVTSIVLPPELQVTAYDKAATGAMQKAPEFNASTRTFTIEWKAVGSGSLIAFPFTAKPSPATSNDSTFVVTARTQGETGAGGPVDISVSSDPITASGDFDSELVVAGDWQLKPSYAMTLQQGSSDSTAPKVQKIEGVDGSFNDMRWRARFDDPEATMPKANFRSIATRYAQNSTLIENSEASYIRSHGPMNYKNQDTFEVIFALSAAYGIEPGTYSVPVDLLDVRPDGREEVVGSTEIVLNVPEPKPTNINLLANLTRDEVKPGDQLRYQWSGSYSAASALKDIRYTLPVPDGLTPETVASAVQNGKLATKVEYSTDGKVWRTLDKGDEPLWSFGSVANTETIRWVRVTERDRQSEYGQSRNTITFRVGASVTAGTTLSPSIKTLEYVDPVAGATTVEPSVPRVAKVVESYSQLPKLGGVNQTASGSINGFGKPYYNGQSIRQDLRLIAGSSAPVSSPYTFAIVPAGMTVASQETWSPIDKKDWNGLITSVIGSSPENSLMRTYASLVGKPAQADLIGSTELSDGSTLYYWKATEAELTGNVAGSGFEQLFSDLDFTLNTVEQGNHSVQVGMGSAVNDSFELSDLNRGYVKSSLSDAKTSLGDYAGLSPEIALALKDLGVTTDNLIVKTLPFTVPGSDSIAVSSEIKGSEDPKPITGNGVATTKLGATTDYTINVKNNGTYSYENFQFIDVLPYADDKYTLNDSARGSKYDLAMASRPDVKLNGKSVDAVVQVSTSTNPPRFDANGNTVTSPGQKWESIAGGTDGAKALRVTLGAGVKFKPGDTISLDFLATVPLSAPRDGSVANNSVAYRLERAGFTAGLETNAGGVKVPAAATDFEISGQLLDSHGDGINGGVEMHLYKLDKDNKPVATGEISLPATSGSDRGVWGFVGIDNLSTYLVKPVVVDEAYTLDSGQLNSGFLKYTDRGTASATANAPYDVSGYDGETQFRLGDAASDVTHWVKDLQAKVSVKTSVSGDIVFVDKDGAVIPKAAEYLKDWNVSLTTKSGEAITDTMVESDGSGTFEMKDLNLAAGDYRLKFTEPVGTGLIFPNSAQPEGFDPSEGVYIQKNLVPGTGIEGLRIRVSDDQKPFITEDPTADKAWNATKVTVAAGDSDTEVTGFAWTLAGPDGFSQSGKSATSPITLPAYGKDGDYTLSVQAVDFAGNLSAAKTLKLKVDKTGPELVAANPVIESTQAKPVVAPTTAAKWIELFGVSATDAGSGMPTTGTLGVTVDSSAVKDGAGTFTVKFTAKDNVGNPSTVLETTFKVSYVGVPTLAVGKDSANFEIRDLAAVTRADTFEFLTKEQLKDLFGVSAKPAHASAPIVDVTIGGYEMVHWATPDSYELVFQGVDSLGTKTVEKKVTLVVEDTVAPALKLGTPEVTFKQGDAEIAAGDAAAWIAAFGATASDAGTGLADPAITVDASTVDYTTAGDYPVVFTATDNAGNTSKRTGTFTVTFVGVPTIEVGKDSANFEIVKGTAGLTEAELQTLFGVKVTPAQPTAPILSITVGGFDDVKWTTPGSYELVFQGIDSLGTKSDAKTVTLVVSDSVAPDLTLGATSVTFKQGDTQIGADDAAAWIAAFGAKATDNGVGLADPAISVDASKVDYTKPGDYQVVFTATDKSGNASKKQGTYSVKFVGVPTLNVGKVTAPFEVTKGSPGLTADELTVLFGVTATPAQPSAPIVEITVAGIAEVDWAVPGSYELVFQGVDSLGTKTVAKPVTLVVDDTIDPDFNLGTSTVVFAKGGTQIASDDAAAWITAFGAVATDNGVGLADPAIAVDASKVDYTKAGSYPVVFIAMDRAGNSSEKTGTYQVKFAGDPVISFGNPSALTHEFGEKAQAGTSDEWVKLFDASAKTAAGTTLSSLTADGSAVKWGVEGTYQVSFEATDSNGNAATSFVTVTVADTTAPVVTVDQRERKHAMVAPATPWTGAEWAKFFGAKADDGKGTGVDAASWQMAGQVNWGVAGSYKVKLTVADKANTANVSKAVEATITIQAPPANATAHTRIPQNDGFLVDPIGLSSTTGTLNPLTSADLGAPSAGGSIELQGTQVLYTPKDKFAGMETVAVTVTDDLGQTGLVEYTFTVVAAPGITTDEELNYSTVVDQPVTIKDAATLPELHGDNLTLVGVDAPAGFAGNVTVAGTDIVFETDDAGTVGAQEFTFKVKDDVGQTADIPVTIEVSAQRIELSLSEGFAGQTELEIALENLVPGADYALEMHSTPVTLASVTAGVDGAAAVKVTVPKGAAVGEHRIVLLNSDKVERASADFTVLKPVPTGGNGGSDGQGADGTGGSGVLSLSGSNPAVIAGAVALGAILLLLAALVLLAARRRAESKQ